MAPAAATAATAPGIGPDPGHEKGRTPDRMRQRLRQRTRGVVPEACARSLSLIGIELVVQRHMSIDGIHKSHGA